MTADTLERIAVDNGREVYISNHAMGHLTWPDVFGLACVVLGIWVWGQRRK